MFCQLPIFESFHKTLGSVSQKNVHSVNLTKYHITENPHANFSENRAIT